MEYISVTQASERWGISARRVRTLCSDGRIAGVVRQGKRYRIPADAGRPEDGRSLRYAIRPAFCSELLERVDRKKAMLDRCRPLTAGEVQRLRDDFLVDYTYNSNAIEGNTLTLRETALVLEGMTVDRKPLKDHLEAVGHRDAFCYMETLAKAADCLCERDIKAIHALLLIDRPADKGVYRSLPVRIVGAYTEPVAPTLIEVKMAELLSENERRKKTLHPIERMARFHLEFEGIHPFIDGNGRTGRLLLNLELIRCGYPPINVKFADRRRYYDAFDAFTRGGSPEAMTALVGEYVGAQLDRLCALTSPRSDA